MAVDLPRHLACLCLRVELAFEPICTRLCLATTLRTRGCCSLWFGIFNTISWNRLTAFFEVDYHERRIGIRGPGHHRSIDESDKKDHVKVQAHVENEKEVRKSYRKILGPNKRARAGAGSAESTSGQLVASCAWSFNCFLRIPFIQ